MTDIGHKYISGKHSSLQLKQNVISFLPKEKGPVTNQWVNKIVAINK